MKEINYFTGIVKILEDPIQDSENNILFTKFRVQLPQIKNPRIINLIFWDKLVQDVDNYYKMDDYIIIEGYLSLPKKSNFKEIEINVFKVYPFFLNSDNFKNFVSNI